MVLELKESGDKAAISLGGSPELDKGCTDGLGPWWEYRSANVSPHPCLGSVFFSRVVSVSKC